MRMALLNPDQDWNFLQNSWETENGDHDFHKPKNSIQMGVLRRNDLAGNGLMQCHVQVTEPNEGNSSLIDAAPTHANSVSSYPFASDPFSLIHRRAWLSSRRLRALLGWLESRLPQARLGCSMKANQITL